MTLRVCGTLSEKVQKIRVLRGGPWRAAHSPPTRLPGSLGELPKALWVRKAERLV